ncbi:MAG: hypothetical protein Unbinned7358contig1001_6 [Prokaryotic dsDNA virus sp.]|nr:MAG: hypothetical protein Unbinned7358contig1001_6 [Prokaryotic dsDNA virus sp.]
MKKKRKNSSPNNDLRIRKVTNHGLERRPRCPEGFEAKKIKGRWVCSRIGANEGPSPIGDPPGGLNNWFNGSGGGGGGWNNSSSGGSNASNNTSPKVLSNK